MRKLNIGLIGYGTVGSGIAKILKQKRKYFNEKFHTDFVIKAVCDRSVHKKNIESIGKVILTTNYNSVINTPHIDVIIELMGGVHPANEVILAAVKKGKHVITANKELLAHNGQQLFREANKHQANIYFESSVGAGIPIIKSISEGVVGNKFNGLYGIINGTCNFILSEMSQKKLTFQKALQEAKKRGYAESNPTLDVSGMDSVHKLIVLVFLSMRKFIKPENIYTEGITHISHLDIEYAEKLNLTIKLLAIAKKQNDQQLEVRVNPTLISKDHPLASVNGIYNAIFLDTNPLGHIMLSGEGAGQMVAASGVISDLINLASKPLKPVVPLLCNNYKETSHLKLKKIDQIRTKFYLRFMATDKPGVLSKITGILGKHGISINSVTQRAHNPTSTVPVVMLTEYAQEKKLRIALEKIYKLSIVKSNPVAIRMEKLQ